jgi:hypothetical protein
MQTLKELIIEATKILSVIEGAFVNNKYSNRPRNSFEASDSSRRYIIWREDLREYIDNCKDVSSLEKSYFFESDSVPIIISGSEYGFSNSSESVLLMENIKKEIKDKLKKLRTLNIKENAQNKIKEIYIFKGQKKFSLIIVGENENKIIEPKDRRNENSWVNKLFDVAKNGKCEYSKTIEAINNNNKLALYDRGFFSNTLILTKKNNYFYPNITIKKILNDDEFFKKRNKFKL